MKAYSLDSLFSLEGKKAVVTGGTGILCGEMARGLAALGVDVAILGRSKEKADAVLKDIDGAKGRGIFVACDVTDASSVADAQQAVEAELGAVDILINGAGGNSPKGTTGGVNIADALEPTFFGLDPDGFRFVFDLNFIGTLLPTQAFARGMVERKDGCIINISSMSGFLPLTKVGAYSAAKAAIENFTRWMSVHFAPANVRVNAIAPGFFLTEQNRFLLTDKETGALTPRGETIISQTPMRRYGTPDELIGALAFLLGPSSSFVTGITVPVDGGFAAFSGV